MAGQGSTEIEIGFEVRGFGDVVRAEDALDDLEARARDAGDGVDNLGDRVRPVTEDVDDLGNTTADTGNKFDGFGAKIGVAFAALGGAAVIGQVGTMFWDMGNQYEGAMNQIAASTGATGAELAGLEDVANDIYVNNFGESWEDVANSLSTVKQMTGATDGELQSMTESALGLRDTFGYEVNESIRSVDTMMNNFGITSDEAFNLLTQGQQNGLDKSGEMLDTVNEYSSQFGALGFTVDDMFETMNAGLEGGAWNLDKVGDAVKEFNIRAKDGSKTSKEAFESLGHNASEMFQTFAAGGPKANEAFKTIVEDISSIEDPVKRNEVGVALFGTQFEDLEVKAFSALSKTGDKFDQTKNSMDAINEVKYDTPMEALAGFGRFLETSLVQPIMTKVMPAINGVVTWTTNNMPVVTAAIVGLSVAFGILGAVIMFTVVPAVWAMMAPFLPVIAIALAIGAVAGVIIWAWQEFDLSWAKIWTNVSNWATSTWDTLTSYFITGWTYLVEWGKSLWQSFSTFMSDLWTSISIWAMASWNTLTSYFTTGWTYLVELGKSLWSGFMNFLSGLWSGIVAGAVAIWNGFVATLSAIWSGIISIGMALWNGYLSYMSFIFNGVLAIATTIWSTITGFLSGLWSGLISLGVSLWLGFKSTVTSIFTGLLSMAISVWEGIKSGITTAIQGAYTAVTSTVSNIYTAIADGFNNAVSFVTGLGQTFYDAGRGLIEQMIGGITSMVGQVTDTISSVAGKVRDFLPFSPAKVGPLSDLDHLDFGGPIEDSILKASPNVRTQMDQMFSGTTAISPETTAIRSDNVPIGPSSSSSAVANSRNSSQNNNITINITGSSDPHETSLKVRDQLEDLFASLGRVSQRTTEV